jgi:tetratricopeptide (TPR) repeat protein/peroxiredoxin
MPRIPELSHTLRVSFGQSSGSVKSIWHGGRRGLALRPNLDPLRVRLLDFGSTREFPGVIALSRPWKTTHWVDLGVADASRRKFLIQCCQGATAALLPARIRRLAFSPGDQLSPSPELNLRPHYRAKLPLEATLLKVSSGLDDFISEKYADQIAAILADWSARLLQSSENVEAVEKVLAPNFRGAPLQPLESQVVRADSALEIRRNEFAREPVLGREAFLQDLRSSLKALSKLLTAEFQITSIDAPPGGAKTRVGYELVGIGKNFYREQRVGEWELEWEASSSDQFRLRRWQALAETQSRSAKPIFVDISEQALGENPSYSDQLLHGSDYWRTVLDGACGIDIYGHNGISVGDIDNDGFDDLYVCQPAGLPNRLYRNQGDGRFEDVTEISGVGILENTACALFVDINNDGLQDLIVVRANGPLLFLNEGGLRFRHKHDAFQFANPPQGTFTGAAVADYDRDGWLDIYFCLYIYYQGTDQYKYPSPYYDAENGPPNFLLRNNRDGTFSDVTARTGLDKNNSRYSFCCAWNDYNGDGWPDLYVVNDFGRKNLYRNNGDGTFTDIAADAGVQDVGAGMSVCWFDYDNDGAEDLYVANMWTAAGKRVSEQQNFQKDAPKAVRGLYRKHANGNSLLQNGGKAFADKSAHAGVEIGRWSWSSDAWDFDHDGFLDLYITNGMVSGLSRVDLNSFFWRQVVANSPVEAKPSHNYEQGWNAINELIRTDGTWSGYERNVFYANNRDGTFSDVAGAVGLDFIEDGRAFALADFDHDGRLEVFLKNRNAPQIRVLKNTMQELPPSISFRFRGSKSNRDAIGTVVTLETESGCQTRTLQAGSGFLSQHSKEMFFGLGTAKGPVEATIRWPSGLMQEFRDLPVNHRICLEEGAQAIRTEPFRASDLQQHRTEEASYDRSSRRTELLPRTVETWLLAPISAPDFSLPDLNGQPHNLSALRGRPLLLSFWASNAVERLAALETFGRLQRRWAEQGLALVTVNFDDAANAVQITAFARSRHLSLPILHASDDVTGIYNILYRYLFDRRRDLALPASFLVNANGEIVKIYQGPIHPDHVEQDFRTIPRNHSERTAKALPFPGVSDTTEFRRNYLTYGSIFFQREYFDQAEAFFQLALRDDPSSAEGLYGLGSVYLKQEKTAEARANFERATKAQASYPDTLANAWNNLGLLATREGRVAESIPYFERAVQLSPDHVVALENLGSAYRQQKRWDEARKVLEHAVAVGPEDPGANYSLGMVYAQIDEIDLAGEYLQRALELRPHYPEALNNLGVLYLRTQRRDEAVANFEKCIQVAPSFDQSYLNLARVYALEGAPDKARSTLLELLKQHPGHGQAQQMLRQLP